MAIKCETYEIRRRSDIPERPGLYAWYIKMSDFDRLSHYIEGLENVIEYKSYLRAGSLFKLTGEFHTYIKPDPNRVSRITNEELLRITTYNFSSPIYIGVTTDLRRRIEEHWDDYENYEGEAEKNIFGARLSSWSNHNGFSPSDLIIKVIYDDAEILNIKELEDLEHVINRIYRPILGIK